MGMRDESKQNFGGETPLVNILFEDQGGNMSIILRDVRLCG
jgi:hypothetical protein